MTRILVTGPQCVNLVHIHALMLLLYVYVNIQDELTSALGTYIPTVQVITHQQTLMKNNVHLRNYVVTD
jgi:hypothetical protein